MKKIFKAADAAKNRLDYQTANFLFAYLLQTHATSVQGLKIGIEYWAEEKDPETGETWGEGNPSVYTKQQITNETITNEDYHSLVFLYTGNDPLNPENYLCIPAPMLSTEALRYAWKYAKREGGFMPRRNHERNTERRAAKASEYDMNNIQKLVGTFQVPAWIFEQIETQ
jgi:hypothetical protein